MFFSGWNARRKRPWSPPEWVLGIGVILGAALLLLDVKPENFWPKTITFLYLVLAAKILSPWRPKDVLQIHLLNLLGLLAAAALKGPQILIFFGLEGVLVLWALLFLYLASKDLCIAPKETVGLFLYGLVLASLTLGGSFLLAGLLPWTNFSPRSWTWTNPWNVSLAQGTLVLKNTPVFRAIWQQGPRPSLPYWRVLTYDTYFHGRWLKLYRTIPSPLEHCLGTNVHYVIRPSEPLEGLPLLGIPLKITPASGFEAVAGGNWLAQKASFEAVQVQVCIPWAWPKDQPPQKYLQVPPEVRQRLRPLVRDLKGRSPLETAEKIIRFLRRHYRYSLEVGNTTEDPVLYFLFHSKRGHCQYWASALALLLRTAGIPARVVTGYLGGQWIEKGHYYLVREREGHFWVEAWLGKGWVRLDATPVLNLPQGWETRIWAKADYLLFLGEELSRSLKQGSLIATPQKIGIGLGILALAGLLGLGISKLRRYIYRDPTQEFLALLEDQGLKREPDETLAELVKRACQKWPNWSREFKSFLQVYHENVYGEKARPEDLEKALKRLKDSFSKGRLAPKIGPNGRKKAP